MSWWRHLGSWNTWGRVGVEKREMPTSNTVVGMRVSWGDSEETFYMFSVREVRFSSESQWIKPAQNDDIGKTYATSLERWQDRLATC